MKTLPYSLVERGTIYTLGYAAKDATAHLERYMRSLCILLVDVRSQPLSRWNPQWNRAALTARYSERYIWDRRLGNVNYRNRDLAIELAEGHEDAIQKAANLICAGTSLVLLCACGDARVCHRTYVAKLIQDALPVTTSCWEERA